MLFEVFHKDKEGELVSSIEYRESSAYDLTKEQLKSDLTIVRPFKYVSKSPFYGLVSQDGKKFMIPDWVEVRSDTIYQDLKYNTPRKKKQKAEIFEFKSSSGNGVYQVRKSSDGSLRCNCPGTWRTKGNCKHVKELRSKES
jgi:hypothetical protein